MPKPANIIKLFVLNAIFCYLLSGIFLASYRSWSRRLSAWFLSFSTVLFLFFLFAYFLTK